MHKTLTHWLRKKNCVLVIVRGLTSRKKEFSGQKLVRYTQEQMFDVVSDVENYDKFVPFCLKSVVYKKTGNELLGRLIVGFPPLTESYTSKVTLVRPYLVKAECTDGSLFHHLTTVWRFTNAPKSQSSRVSSSCKVNFYLTFEFKSLLHTHLANLFFDQLVDQMQVAFFNEAHKRYGEGKITSTDTDARA